MRKILNFVDKVSQIRVLLIIGSLTHLSATISVYIAGSKSFVPSQIYPSGALWKDAVTYFDKCQILSQRLGSGDLSFIFNNEFDIHLRLYSISYFLFSPVFGENIICFEPLNMTLFLSVLFLIFKIGEKCFNTKVGFWASVIINFSPTFLLHSVQPLRDLPYVLVFLTLIYLLLTTISEQPGWKKITSIFIVCFFLILMLWLIRQGAYPVYVFTALLSLGLFLIENLKNLRPYLAQSALYLLFFGSVLMIPYFFTSLQPQTLEEVKFSENQKNTVREFKIEQYNRQIPRTVQKLNNLRHTFIVQQEEAGGGGSLIYKDLVFESVSDIILFAPKSLLIGLFAPFPDMWLAEGKSYGKFGRLISAFETSIIYILSVFAAITIFYHYKNVRFWLLFLIILAGCSALGLVVPNVGAIYRMRYIFWFLLIILGTNGIFEVLGIITRKGYLSEPERKEAS